MKLTNKFNLPQAVVNAIQKHEHKQADYSVTELNKGSVEIAYSKVYSDKYEEDVCDRFWALFGTVTHAILEEGAKGTSLESEVYMEVKLPNLARVSGTADLIDWNSMILKDYKTCSVWKAMLSEADYEDWKNQLKGYAYLIKHTKGYIFTKGEIIMLFRDWSRTQAEREAAYPQKPIQTIQFSWTEADIDAVETKWVVKIEEVKELVRRLYSMQEIGFCSDKDCWKTPDSWAVMKEGRKSAVRVLETREDAMKMLGDLGAGHTVIFRAGNYKKCKGYCAASKNGFCKGAER